MNEPDTTVSLTDHLDVLDSCLESYWCITEADTDDRLLAEGAIHAANRIRLLISTREPVAWLRSLDGTDSYHPCAKGDPGCFPVYP